jgi:hypothetical protein
MSELLDFQDAFAAALAGAPSALRPWLASPAAGEAGLSVYRNTIAKGCVDALAANFPTVVRLVGDDWFTAAAARFARQQPPSRAALLAYGEGFSDWLADFPPAADLPFLPAMAAMDALWTTALFAAEADVLTPADFAVGGEALAAARVALHPSLGLARYDTGLPGLWLAAREDGARDLSLDGEPQALLIVRPGAAVHARLLDAAGYAFLTACRTGQTLGEAMGFAAEADPQAELPALFAALIADGVFSGLIPGDLT